MPRLAAPALSNIARSRRGLPAELRWYLENLRKVYPKLTEYELQNVATRAMSALGNFNRVKGVASSLMLGEFHPPSAEFNRRYFKDVGVALEGEFVTLYVDLENLVSVAIGYNLDINGPGAGLAAAQALPFFFSANHETPGLPMKRATPADIKADYDKVRTFDGNKTNAYEQAKAMKLVIEQGPEDGSQPGTANGMFKVRVDQFVKNLSGVYAAQWLLFPSPAKMALLSVAFANTIPGGTIRGKKSWPNLDGAVRKFDFLAASEECRLSSADTNNLAARSAWQRMLFEYAFAEMYPWSGPDAFPPRDRRRQNA